MLLIQGRCENIARLHEGNGASVLGPVELVAEKQPRRQRAMVSLGIFLGGIGLVAFQIVSLPLAAILGVFLVFVTGCLTPEDAYAGVAWRVIILIGSMLSLGVAMEHTGMVSYLAERIDSMFDPDRPYWLLAGFFPFGFKRAPRNVKLPGAAGS